MQKLSIKTLLLVLGTTILAVSACRKDKDIVNRVSDPVTPSDSVETGNVLADSVLKDSILYYTRDLYLWANKIPSGFNPLSFSGAEELMEGIRPYSIEAGFGFPVDRWSFAMKQKDWDNMSSGLNLVQDDVTGQGDFGMSVFFKAEDDLRVRLVEPNSPAGKAGIHRGWQITRINSNNNITTANTGFIIKNIYESTSSSIVFKKPDGTSETISLSASHYTEQPVYLDSVYTIGSKRVGYLVYNSFLGNEEEVTREFQRVFNKFSANNVNEVVIDLRYNGGGYVSLQEKLANYLINTTGNGSLMMEQQYNETNSQHNERTNFRKTGSLDLTRIYFIVSNATASASELLINNLTPYLDVKLVGPAQTHGKPVGFFPVPVGKEWYVFPVSFRSVNKNGDGNYFNGIAVNGQVKDGLDKDWGDATEACLASVLRNITTGRYKSSTLTGERIISTEVMAGNAALEEPFLKVTVDKKRF